MRGRRYVIDEWAGILSFVTMVGAGLFTRSVIVILWVCFSNGFAVSRIDRVYGSRKMDGVGVDAVGVLRSRLAGSDAATRVDVSWN
jgi:hypothetical protein